MRYITNVECTVRVHGEPVRVPASTRLPDGVAVDELARLLRFRVIREAELAPVSTSSKRARKKTTADDSSEEPAAAVEEVEV